MQSTKRESRAQKGADSERALPLVLHCIPTLSGGGAERQLRQLIPHLARRGINVAIFSRFAPGDVEEMTALGAICLPIRSRGNHNPRLGFELFKVIRTLRPQIVQSWLPQMDILCGFLGRSAGAKWILSERCSPKAYPPTTKNIVRRLIGGRADLVIANSQCGLSVWGKQPKTVVQNGIDLEEIDRIPPGHYSETPLLNRRTVIISIARLTEQKQLNVLIDAMKIISGEVQNALLLVVGEGPNRDQLMARVAAQGLEHHIHFAGFRPDAILWLRSADIFASASLFEGHPNSVIEAAAARVPMVLSDIPEHRDSVGEGACYVPPGDVAQFARSIISLIGSQKLRLSLSAKARRKISALSVTAVAEGYVRLYRNLGGEDFPN